MSISRLHLIAAAALSVAACSKPVTQAQAPPLQPTGTPVATGTTPGAAYSAVGTPAVGAPATTAAVPGADPNAPLPPPANGYSCTFPGPGGRAVLARFTLDGTGGAHDDQGLPFTVLTNTPTALVLAHARDNLGTAADGDVGAYVVAIDRRTLGMVSSAVGLNGPDGTRRGHCIAG